MATVLRISSENSRFQQVLALKDNREKRSKLGMFLVEGVIAINFMLEAGWEVDAWWYSQGARLSDWARSVLARPVSAHHIELAPELMQKLSDKEETSELIATVKIPADDLSRISFEKFKFVVVFDRPQSPGNLGSSIRSADALGADGVIITGHAADPYHPQAVRGSMGSLFALPVVRLPSQHELTPWLEMLKGINPTLQVVGTSARATQTVHQADLTLPTILVMGNESVGLSKGYKELCSTLLGIPQTGRASSLNVSCATSIILYEAAIQRSGSR